MTTLQTAGQKARELSRKAVDLTNSSSASPQAKREALAAAESALDEFESLKSIAAKARAFGGLDMGSLNPHALLPGAVGYAGLTDTPSLNAAPSLTPSEDQVRGLHEAVLSHKSFRVEVATKGPSADVPDALMPGMVELSHEPTRILNLLPTRTMDVPVVEYLRHVSTTGTAGMVPPGGLKPSVTINTDKVEARARKIAVVTTLNDEDVEDFNGFLGYVQTELRRLVIDQENIQLLTGDGLGEDLLGIFSVTGILTRVKGASPETGIDTLELAATDLRNGPAFVEPTVYAMHPTTWSTTRRIKDGQGRYILGNPSEQDAARLWGVPVVKSTGIAPGTVLTANLPAAATAHVRKGLVIEVSYSHADQFQRNQIMIRCEERIALAVAKPAAASKVTGL
ncbi:MAG: phage major capsid protein [Mycobacteriaceae bacterium]